MWPRNWDKPTYMTRAEERAWERKKQREQKAAWLMSLQGRKF